MKIIVSVIIVILLNGCFQSKENTVEETAKVFLLRVNSGDYSLLEYKSKNLKYFLLKNKQYNKCIKKLSKHSTIMKTTYNKLEEIGKKELEESSFPKQQLREIERKYSAHDDFNENIKMYTEFSKILKPTKYKNYNRVFEKTIELSNKYKNEIIENPRYMKDIGKYYLMRFGLYEPLSKEFINESSQCIAEVTGYKPMLEIKNIKVDKQTAYVSYISNKSEVATIKLTNVNNKWIVD